MLQFLPLPQQLEGTTEVKLPACYQGLHYHFLLLLSLYASDTLLAALADDIFKRESFRELPFSFSAPTLCFQCFQHQLEVIISSLNLQVTPTLLP